MKIFSAVGNLGDNLWLTPLIANSDIDTVVMKEQEKNKSIWKIFDGLCKVEFSDHSEPHCKKTGDGHNSQKHLNAFGVSASPIPKIKLTEEEICFGEKIMNGIENPVVISYNTSGNLSNYGDKYRSFTLQEMRYICGFLIKNGFTPVNLGTSHNSFEIEGVTNILDLDIRSCAACFKFVGKMISNESGPLYLMLSVGGRVLNFIPPHCPTWFQYDRYVYKKEEWKMEQDVRIEYAKLRNPEEIKEKINFLL